MLIAPSFIGDAIKVQWCVVDVTLNTDPKTLTAVWMGDLGLAAARSSGAIELEGQRDLVRSVPKWFGLHPLFASVDHPSSDRGSPVNERDEFQDLASRIRRRACVDA